jgi:hypothetical protein
MQIEDKERQKLNYKLHVILKQKGILVFVFANYFDDVLVWNHAMSGGKRLFCSACSLFCYLFYHFSHVLPFFAWGRMFLQIEWYKFAHSFIFEWGKFDPIH